MEKHLEKVPEEKKIAIAKSLTEMIEQQGSYIPMVCEASECPFAKQCPLQQESIAPKGQLCPVEKALIEYLTVQYAQSLGIDTQNYIEMSMLADLVEVDVYDRRTSADLSLKGFFDEQAVGVDKMGNIVLRKEEAVAMAVKTKLKKRKDDLRRMFMSTREVKAKYKLKDTKDFSQMLAALRDANEEAKGKLPPAEERPALDVTEDSEVIETSEESIESDWEPNLKRDD